MIDNSNIPSLLHYIVPGKHRQSQGYSSSTEPEYQDTQTLQTINNLALVYRLQGQYKGAETLHERVLASREKLLGCLSALTPGVFRCLSTP